MALWLLVTAALGQASLLPAAGEPVLVRVQRWDHRGSLGLLVAGGVDFRSTSFDGDDGFSGLVELGGTLALGERLSLKLAGRFNAGSPLGLGGSVHAGVRNLFGDRLKTFVDAEVVALLAPSLSFGLRGAVGLQYELVDVVGVYAAFGLHLSFFNGIRFGGDLSVGLQFRTYLLE